ncbi:MAG TPA: prepilin peptidase [Thermoanaerobaculia bacterium]|nr:prepilin peptidase [Thermoanaerobaculia bacterium]
MDLFVGLWIFALGAIIGSFLNVVIHRFPREESIVFPPSRCPRCGARIRPWDNVPIVSWLILLGRCRDCRSPIAVRYPLVELANGLFWLAAWLHLGLTLSALLVALAVSMTIALIFIDAEIQILPDVIDLPGIAVGLGIGWLGAGLARPHLVLSSSLLDSILGAAFGAGLLLAVALAYRLIRGIEGMGLGDVKMIAMIGAVCGWAAVLPVIFLASVVGAVIGIAIALRKDEGLRFALPFGVFLGLAFLGVLFFGRVIQEWYFGFLTVALVR